VVEEVGGFFASLKLMTDEGSFQKGEAKLANMGEKLGSMVRWAAGLFGLAEGIKSIVSAATAAQEVAASAFRFNMSFSDLKAWGNAWQEVGGTVEQVESMMGRMARMQTDIFALGRGQSNQSLEDMAWLGLNPGDAKTKTTEQLATEIIQGVLNKYRGAKSDSERQKALRLGEGLAPEANTWIIEALKNGWNVDSKLNYQRGLSFETGAQADAGGKGVMALNNVKTGLGNAGQAFSSQFMADIQPALKEIGDWMHSHPDEIASLTKGLADLTAAIVILAGGLGINVLGMGAGVFSFFNAKTPDQKTAALSLMEKSDYKFAYALAGLVPGLREKMSTPAEHDKASASNELNRLRALNRLQVEVTVKTPDGRVSGKTIKSSEDSLLMFGN
jgi:hypothetical protein